MQLHIDPATVGVGPALQAPNGQTLKMLVIEDPQTHIRVVVPVEPVKLAEALLGRPVIQEVTKPGLVTP